MSFTPISAIDGGGDSSGDDSFSPASNLIIRSPTIKVSTLITYIKEVVSPALEGRSYVHPSLINLLEDSSSQDKLRQFITDPQVKSILIQRNPEENEEVSFIITEEANYSHPLIGHILIKRSLVLEADKSISSQLLYMSLEKKNILGRFIPIVLNCLLDRKKMISANRNQVDQTEIHQQNIDKSSIPEVHLKVHPAILKVMNKCADEGRKATIKDFADIRDDLDLMNQVEHQVFRWTRQLQKVIYADRDASTGTALEEINFWLNLEQALLRIVEQRESPEVALTIDILIKGGRLHAVDSFDHTGIQLEKALTKVNDYNRLMKNFPINGLLSATDLDKIKSTFQVIFHHMRKHRQAKYPIGRTLKLFAAVSRDLSTQLIKVLGTQRMLEIPFGEFEKIMRSWHKIFISWAEQFTELKFLSQHMFTSEKDLDKTATLRLDLGVDKLRSRINQLEKFREEHHQLYSIIVKVLRLAPPCKEELISDTTKEAADKSDLEENVNLTTIEEIKLAYELVRYVDPLDMSKEGNDSWEVALKRYEERIDRIEAQIAAKLRNQLEKAKTDDEKFRIFSRHNSLFVRPQIRGAIRQYQKQMVQPVKYKIDTLLGECKNKGANDSSLANVLKVHKQFSYQMKRVQEVLGEGWKNDLERKNLKAYGDSFRIELYVKMENDDKDKI